MGKRPDRHWRAKCPGRLHVQHLDVKPGGKASSSASGKGVGSLSYEMTMSSPMSTRREFTGSEPSNLMRIETRCSWESAVVSMARELLAREELDGIEPTA